MAAKIVGQLRAILGLDKTKFDQGLDGAEKKANSFGNVMKKIGGILAAAFSVAAIIRFSKEAMRAAAEVEGIKNAFTKFGAEGTRVLADMKKATRGVIQEDELMRLANMAQSLGIPFKDLGTYLTFATNQAIRLGKPVQEFADLMINAVGKQQARGLVQMGLATKEATAAFKDAGGILGFVIKKLEEMGTVADTTAIKMGKLTVAGTELKEAWGAWLNKSPVIANIRTFFTDVFNAFADENATFQTKVQALFPGNKTKAGQRLTWKRGRKQTEKERAAEAPGTLSPDYWKSIQLFQQGSKQVEEVTEETENAIDALIKKINEEAIAANNLTAAWKILHAELAKKAGITGLAPVDISNLKIPMLSTKPKVPGLQPFGGTPSNDAEITKRQTESLTESLQEQQIAVNILSNAFDGLFSSTEGGFKSMIDSLLMDLKRLMAELIALIVVLGIINVLTGGGLSFGGVVKQAFGQLFARGAEGGIVPGGYPRDTYPALLSSGETILTPEQSRDFNRSINVNVKGEIAGRAIALLGRRTEGEN